jgi:hypothetical protein
VSGHRAHVSRDIVPRSEPAYLRTVIWDVDPQDRADPGVSVIEDRVLSHAHAGMIVVMHVKPQTSAAILRGLASRGLQQSSLTQMFEAAGCHA